MPQRTMCAGLCDQVVTQFADHFFLFSFLLLPNCKFGWAKVRAIVQPMLMEGVQEMFRKRSSCIFVM